MADEDQSIDDQADTATGGLVNDMPGLPMSPPGRGPGPPTALGGLAQAFHGMMGGQRPPQPLPPGQSPWQTPGQSQRPAPPNQRWQGSTASLYLPRGSLQPPAKFTPYMRGPRTTNYMQWGQDDDNGQSPQPFETLGMYQKTANFFGQNGSASIIPLALSMGRNAGAFLNGVMQGQQYAAKMHREKMLDDAQELELRQQKEMYTYYDTVNEYEVAKGVGKAGDIGGYMIKGRTVLDALNEEAMKLGDEKFQAILGTGSVEKALQYLHERNNNWQNLKSANQSAKKQEEEDNNKEWGVPSEGDASGTGSQNEHPEQQQQQQTPRPGGAAPNAVAGPGQQTTAEQLQDPNVARYKEAGLNNYREGYSLNNVPKGKPRAYAADFAQQLGSAVDRVKAKKDAEKLNDEQVQQELDKVIPGMGDDFHRLATGTPLPSGALGRTPYWQSLGTLVAADPLIQAASKKDYATSGRSGTRLTAGSRMGDAAVTVLKEMKKFPEGTTVPENVISQWVATGYTGDPKWSNLFTAVNNYLQEAQSLQSPTGRFFETEMEEQRKNIRLSAGLPAIRGILKVDAENSSKLIDQLRENYHRATRDPSEPPTYDPKRTDILRALTNLDEQNGFEGIPEENLPPELHGLGRGDTGQGNTGGGDGKVHDWREYFQ
jgi:hypothetical protein